jgi:Holliday junction resolvasome RuvABC ATP-dependent DNA helicase subunit
VMRTPRGRMATRAAFTHFGYAPPARSLDLFGGE